MINKFVNVEPIDRLSAEAAFLSDNPRKICDALIRVTFHDAEFEWVQEKCIHFLMNENFDIKRLAIICIGHLARIHKKLNLGAVLPYLLELQTNPSLKEVVEDTLEDIEIFVSNN